jgi:hypothetical protein
MDAVSRTPEQIACFRQNDLLSQHSAYIDDFRRRAQRVANEFSTSDARRGLMQAFNDSLLPGDAPARRELLRLLREEWTRGEELLQLAENLRDEEAELSARMLGLQFSVMIPPALEHGVVLPIAPLGTGAAQAVPIGTVDSRSVRELSLHLAGMHPRVPMREAEVRAGHVAAVAITVASDAAAVRAEMARQTQRSTSSTIAAAAAELNAVLKSGARRAPLLKENKDKLKAIAAEATQMVDEQIQELSDALAEMREELMPSLVGIMVCRAPEDETLTAVHVRRELE